MDRQTRLNFAYLFERVGEPLYFSPRGRDTTSTLFNVPRSSITCREVQDASDVTRRSFASGGSRAVMVQQPTQTPDLTNIARNCPRTALYSYFNPNHRNATNELRQIFLNQRSTDQLLSVASVCRDSPLINCKLWINSFASAVLVREDLRNFNIPAIWEVMPDQFFGSFTMRQAFRQAELPPNDRGIITVDASPTGRNIDPESRLGYWREDVGINSHHWHWHLIYRLDDPRVEGRRKGEMFYYMHHALIARYDTERLGNGLPRVRPLVIDDNPVLKEGYFGKLFDTNSGQNWGGRQASTPLKNLNRPELSSSLRNVTLEQIRKWRDRIMEAIDTGFVNGTGGNRLNLNIDILGDIIEASSLSPNPQFYGPDGFHNVGHVLIAHSHDPENKFLENMGPMGDTTTAMRVNTPTLIPGPLNAFTREHFCHLHRLRCPPFSPPLEAKVVDIIFYRWHKYVDIIFDTYKQTLQPYQDVGGEFPLVWQNIQVTNVSVQVNTFGSSGANVLSTFRTQSNVDLSRGLDFTRTDINRLGAIWLRFTHLNNDPFTYTITARNNTNAQQRATVRIYLAPRFNEHGERLVMTQQRKLFFELDKFTEMLRPGDNTITRRSTDSSVTVPWEQTFRDLERTSVAPAAETSICGCGWPQHMLLPRGTAQGQQFDLVVFLTNGQDDLVPGTERPIQQGETNCRESLSYCGRLNSAYPDRKPMGYPWDRNPYTQANPQNPRGPQVPVETLEQYVSRIPNMRAIQIRIVHNASRLEMRNDGGPTGQIREINGDPTAVAAQPMCPDQGQMPRTRPTMMTTAPTTTSTTTSRPTSSTRPQNPTSTSRPSRPGSSSGSGSQTPSPQGSPTTSRPTWTRPQQSWGNNQWTQSRPQRPQSPTGWPRHGSHQGWGWGG